MNAAVSAHRCPRTTGRMPCTFSQPELKKAVRGGSYESIALPLPIVSIEPLPQDAAEGDNDEIRYARPHSRAQ